MDRDTIIDGLRMTMDLCVFDPSTGEEIEPHLLNDINRETYDACKGALEILERLDTDTDTISRQDIIQRLEYVIAHGVPNERGKHDMTAEAMLEAVKQLPPAQPGIIYCKDCRKHNKKIGFDENFHTVWKEDACLLASWRGKAQGHEFDYQFCASGERKTE